MTNIFDITKFGAISDGKTDCTKAIQAALDEAGKVDGEVFVPAGVFLCGYLKVPPRTTISGTHAWGYRHNGGSVLKLNDASAKCMLDITGAWECNLSGLCLDGDHIGTGVHGVMLDKERYNIYGHEDTPKIENCRISNFSGNGAHYNNVWCYSVRHSEFGYNDGHGFYMQGCDGFLADNWFSDNKKAGFFCDVAAASLTFTANRFECNHGAGFEGKSGSFINFTGNYFDYNGTAGLYLYDEGEYRVNITATGNIFHTSGWNCVNNVPDDKYISSHVYIERAANISLSDNVFSGGLMNNKNGEKVAYPDYSIVYRQLRSSIIKDNVMQNGAGKENLVDLGNHAEGVIVKDNVGGILEDYSSPWPIFSDHWEKW